MAQYSFKQMQERKKYSEFRYGKNIHSNESFCTLSLAGFIRLILPLKPIVVLAK